jgi:PBP1b-binding outer membrane lipoprotein LpoB
MPKKSRQSDEPSTSTGARRRRAVSSSSSSGEEERSTKVTSAGLSISEMNTASNNMVKYMLNYSSTKFPIKRADISKNVNVSTKQFPEVFKNCMSKLKSVYGLEVSEIQDSKTSKVYIIHSVFKSAVIALQFPQDQRYEISLLFIILSYIFMKGGEVQEGEKS